MCDTDFESGLVETDLEDRMLDRMPDELKLWNYHELLAKKQAEGLNADEEARLAKLTAKTAFLREEADIRLEAAALDMTAPAPRT